MTFRPRTVTVKQLPAKLDRHSERVFFHELERAMNVERPAIVLDCSQIEAMDHPAIHLLLCCLEEAMKRNGDVRLTAVSAHAMESLREMGADRLFRVFDTNEKAIESFQRRAVFAAPYVVSNSALASEHAA